MALSPSSLHFGSFLLQQGVVHSRRFLGRHFLAQGKTTNASTRLSTSVSNPCTKAWRPRITTAANSDTMASRTLPCVADVRVTRPGWPGEQSILLCRESPDCSQPARPIQAIFSNFWPNQRFCQLDELHARRHSLSFSTSRGYAYRHSQQRESCLHSPRPTSCAALPSFHRTVCYNSSMP